MRSSIGSPSTLLHRSNPNVHESSGTLLLEPDAAAQNDIAIQERTKAKRVRRRRVHQESEAVRARANAVAQRRLARPLQVSLKKMK